MTLWTCTSAGQLQRRVLGGHASDVTSVAFAPDSKTLASASLDGTVKLWDAGTAGPWRVPGPMQGGARAVAFSPDAKLLASGGNDQALKIWTSPR